MASYVCTKIIVIYAMIDIFLLVIGAAYGLYTPNEAHSFMATFYEVDSTNTTPTMSGNMDEKIGLSQNMTGMYGTVPYSRGGLWAVWSALKWIAMFIFSPVFFLMGVGAPMFVVLVFGVVPSVMFIIALLSFIRGHPF